MTRARLPSRRRSAFTLVELVLVLSVLAIASAVAVPRYAHAIQRYRLDAAAKRIAADLEYVGAYARAQSAGHSVTFDIPTCGYTSTAAPTGPDRHKASMKISLGGEPYRVALISASFGGSSTATFNGFGTPAAGGSVLIGAGKEGRRITLDAASGRATVSSEGIP
ncbi:MAG: Tfp pilus assembly protein FimT/FimU [Phycisphaerales bacterium]